MPSAAKADLLNHLRERTQQIAASQRRPCKTGTISTGFSTLDRLLPHSGLEPGTLIEWLAGGPGCGSLTLSLHVAAHALAKGGACVVIDSAAEFYPPAAAGLGLPLERTILVRPGGPRLALWAWEQALRFPGVAVTLGEIGSLSDRPFRRLQLAAEAGGGLGFLVRPAACRAEPSWAAVRLAVAPLPSRDWNRRWRVELVQNGRSVEVNPDDETNSLPLVSELARAATAAV